MISLGCSICLNGSKIRPRNRSFFIGEEDFGYLLMDIRYKGEKKMYNNNYLSRSTSSKQQDSGVPKNLVEGLYAVFTSAKEEGYVLPSDLGNVANNLMVPAALKGKQNDVQQDIFSFASILEQVIEQEQTKEEQFLNELVKKYGELEKYPFLNNEIKEIEELRSYTGNSLIANFPLIFKKVQLIAQKLYAYQNMIKNNQIDIEKLLQEVESITEPEIFSAVTEYVHDADILELSVEDFLDTKFKEYISNYLMNKGKSKVIVDSLIEKIMEVSDIKNYSALQSEKKKGTKIKDIREMKTKSGKRVIDNIKDFGDAMVISLLNGKLRGATAEGNLTISGASSTGRATRTLSYFTGKVESGKQMESDNILIFSSSLELITDDVLEKIRQANNGALTAEKISEYIQQIDNNTKWVIRYSSKDQSGGNFTQYLEEGWGERKNSLRGGSGAVTAKHVASLDSRVMNILEFQQMIGGNVDITDFLFVLANTSKSLIYENNQNKAKELLLQLSFLFLLEDWGIEKEVEQAEKKIEKYPKGANVLHVFFLNGEYYPGSFFLRGILENIRPALTIQPKKIMSLNSFSTPNDLLNQYENIKQNKPSGIERWNELRGINLNGIQFGIKIDEAGLKQLITALQTPLE